MTREHMIEALRQADCAAIATVENWSTDTISDHLDEHDNNFGYDWPEDH